MPVVNIILLNNRFNTRKYFYILQYPISIALLSLKSKSQIVDDKKSLLHYIESVRERRKMTKKIIIKYFFAENF